ncbi:nucleotidyltransferase domain-containing protein [Pyrobaculum aerophilum]|uniref:DNA polymerase subunit beta n=1 Tax=Pyrobaculum aerophilum TaxID=13773 RepID=A0A371QXQ9_9CREN|nr:nucleotidyltransferase domain-containing protein [Pyrobaculum aerophilum]RFA95329.1 DNA polymerase subunit beta [Pyrobaculum aerophilum]RFA98171.1 DNA polymerase subunit beta [Pyrobaculum aerophilum]
MAKEVVDEILKLVEALRREGVEVDAVYLFGSWARGDWLYDSDVDIVIVSPAFREMPWLRRLELVAKVEARLDLKHSFDVLPYAPEELGEVKSAVLRDAMRYWKRII